MLRDREKFSRCQAASDRLSSSTGGPFAGVFEQMPSKSLGHSEGIEGVMEHY